MTTPLSNHRRHWRKWWALSALALSQFALPGQIFPQEVETAARPLFDVPAAEAAPKTPAAKTPSTRLPVAKAPKAEAAAPANDEATLEVPEPLFVAPRPAPAPIQKPPTDSATATGSTPSESSSVPVLTAPSGSQESATTASLPFEISPESSAIQDLPASPTSEPSPLLPAAELQSLKRQRYEKLRNQIERLKGHLGDRQSVADGVEAPPRSENPEGAGDAVPGVSETTELPDSGAAIIAPETPVEDPASPSPAVPMTAPGDSTEEVNQEPDAGMQPLDPSHPPVPSEALSTDATSRPVDGEIDRFSLATSLLGTGDCKYCLKILDEINIETLSKENQLWSKYMRATCLRRLGDVDEAQALYRQLLGEPDAAWLADLSRWWLDNLEEKTRLLNDKQRLTQTLTAWEEEIANLSSAKP